MFKAYPTLSDPGLFLSMLSLFPETFPCTYLIPSRRRPSHFPHPRPPSPDRDGAPALTRGTPSPSLPLSLADPGHGQRELLLRVDACIRNGEWLSIAGLYLGGTAARYWESERGVRSHAGVVFISPYVSGGVYTD